jgi:hypothetical protein
MTKHRTSSPAGAEEDIAANVYADALWPDEDELIVRLRPGGLGDEAPPVLVGAVMAAVSSAAAATPRRRHTGRRARVLVSWVAVRGPRRVIDRGLRGLRRRRRRRPVDRR